MTDKVAIFETVDGCNVWLEGHVVIEGVGHYVRNGYVSCNSSLNSRAWGVTEMKSRCAKCFNTEEPAQAPMPEPEYKQLELFV